MEVNKKQQNNQTVQNQSQDLRAMIKRNADIFKMALPKSITPERMMRIAMTAVTKNPQLAACTQASFFGSVLTAAQLGLEVNTPLGHAYLIPYKNECQFQLGYQGVLELAYRSGKFKRIKAVVVHEGDEFIYSYGINPELIHVPKGSGMATHVYALYELVSGGYDFEVWTWERVIQHGKTYSKSFNRTDSAWQTAPEEMAKKTVLLTLLKYAPKAVELAEGIQSDNSIIKKQVIHDADSYEIVTDMSYGDDSESVAEKSDMSQAAELQNTTPPQLENEPVQHTPHRQPAAPKAQKQATPPPPKPQQKKDLQSDVTAEDEAALDALFENQQDAGMLGFSM